MNKAIRVILICATTITVGGALLWWGGLDKLFAGQVACGFSRTLAQYVSLHAGKLPLNWRDFEAWQIREYGCRYYTAESSASMVEILQSSIVVTNVEPRFIRVLDPRLKSMEHFMNWRIYDAWIKATTTNHNAQPHDTSNPHSPSAQGSDGR